jgi:uroporphyrinogen-III synthase
VPDDRPLAGVRVLVTRPAAQAGGLARLIEEAGGEAIVFPALEIAPPRDAAALDKILARLREFDSAIFISANAVHQGLGRLAARGLSLPPGLALAAVGEATARALKERGIADVVSPGGRFDSEALLATQALTEVDGKRIVIFRGEGGRELLADELRRRGARVEYAQCYRRVRPATDPAALLERLARGTIDIVTVTSVASLTNLLEIAGTGGRARLLRLPFVVVSTRLGGAARAAGLEHPPLESANASDEAIVARIRAWRASRNSL